MDLREWLHAIAMRNGSTPSGAKHYAGFATQIRKDFPRLPMNEETVEAVGASLGGQFPAWDELRAAIKAALSELTATPSGGIRGPRVLTEAEREAEAERFDREWWTARIDAIAALRHPEAAHREACGMLETLTRPPGTIHERDPGAYPRPWALERLRAIRDNTREAIEKPEYIPRAAE